MFRTVPLSIIRSLPLYTAMYRGADKSLARPGRKQAQRPNSNFCKPLKNNSEACPSNQVSTTAMTSASDENWRPVNCFFQSGRAKDLSAPLYMSYKFADSLQAGSGWIILILLANLYDLSVNLYDIYHCCVDSGNPLMMDRGTVRNMLSFIPKINLR